MLSGKRRKFQKLKAEYDRMEDDSITLSIMELGEKDGEAANYDDWEFVIDIREFCLLTEMYLLYPKEVDYEELERLMHAVYSRISLFAGKEPVYNTDRIILCKILLGEQYRHYEKNLLEINDFEEKGQLKDIGNVVYWVLRLADAAGKYGYAVYGKEITYNAEKYLGKNLLLTKEMRNQTVILPEGHFCANRCKDCRYLEIDNDFYNDGTRRCAWRGEWVPLT